MDRRYFPAGLCVFVCVCVYMLMAQFVIPWTVACQAPLFIGFPRQEYWSGLPFLNPGSLFDMLLTYRKLLMQIWKLFTTKIITYKYNGINSNTLATWCEELTHWKRPWCWEILKAGGEGDDRGWDVWMALPAQWTWVWASSRSWWWTGKPGMLQSMGSQSQTRLSDWTELRVWTYLEILFHNISSQHGMLFHQGIIICFTHCC